MAYVKLEIVSKIYNFNCKWKPLLKLNCNSILVIKYLEYYTLVKFLQAILKNILQICKLLIENATKVNKWK